MFGSQNEKVVLVNLGSIAADVAQYVALGCKAVVTGVHIVMSAAITASDTNYLGLTVKNVEQGSGTTVLGELDSRAAHENGLAAKTVEALNLGTALTVESDDVIEVAADANGTIAGDCVVAVTYTTTQA